MRGQINGLLSTSDSCFGTDQLATSGFGNSPNKEDTAALPTCKGFFRIQVNTDETTGIKSMGDVRFIVTSGSFLSLATSSDYSYFHGTPTRTWYIQTNDDCNGCGKFAPSISGFTDASISITCEGSPSTLYSGWYGADFGAAPSICNIHFDYGSSAANTIFNQAIDFFEGLVTSSGGGECDDAEVVCCSDFNAVGHYQDYGTGPGGEFLMKLAYVDYGIKADQSDGLINCIITTPILASDLNTLISIGNSFVDDIGGPCPICDECGTPSGCSSEICPCATTSGAILTSYSWCPKSQQISTPGQCQTCNDSSATTGSIICGCIWAQLKEWLTFLQGNFCCSADGSDCSGDTPCPDTCDADTIGQGCDCNCYECITCNSDDFPCNDPVYDDGVCPPCYSCGGDEDPTADTCIFIGPNPPVFQTHPCDG